MPETLLTYDQWLATLADNDTGEIGAQDLKDALYSLNQNWLVMAKRLTSTQSFSAATKITMNSGEESLGQGSGYDDSLDRLTIQTGGDGQYLLHWGCSVKKQVTGTVNFELAIYKNGIRSYSFAPEPKVTITNEWKTMSAVGVWGGVAAADYFELWGVPASSTPVYVNNAYLFIQRIG